MTLERVRAICLKFPHATEQIQWGNDLVFKIGGKMFAVAALESKGNALSFKCSPEEFALLIENDGIVPAPYLARAHWVALERFDALSSAELAKRLRDSYDLVFAGLTKKAQAEFGTVKRGAVKPVAVKKPGPSGKKPRGNGRARRTVRD